MKIGIDIDETLVYLAQDILDILNELNNTKYTLDSITQYKIEKCIEVSNEDINYAVNKALLNNPKPIEHSVEVMEWIFNNYNVYFLTRRWKKHENITKELLNIFVPYLRPYKLFMDCDKADIVNKYDIKYMIEDRAKHAKDIADKTNCTVFLMDKPWNRHLKEQNRIIRVDGWKTIMLYLLGKKE